MSRTGATKIGVRVRSLRNMAGMTQAQVAELAEITIESMSRIERGHLQPSTALVGRLAAALGVRPGDLFEVTNATPKEPTLRPVERRLLAEVHGLPDELVEDVIRGIRLLVGVGRNIPEDSPKKSS